MEKADVVIQVKDNLNKLLDSPDINVQETWEDTKPSIYKIPHFMRQVQPKAFEPQFVSFGPYHNDKPHLLSMELEKLKAFHRFKTNSGINVESIVTSVSSILEDLRGSYDKLEGEWKKDLSKFLQVMIVDGCFMLEFFTDCPESLMNMSGDIKRDMLLLENQLPMKLLHHLYSMANVNNSPTSQEGQNQKIELISLICNSMGIREDGVTRKCLHILDMYKSSLLYPLIDRKNQSEHIKVYDKSDPEYQIIRPATQLREAGIKFKESKTRSLTDISFDPKQGVLTLPHVGVDDDTEPTLLNVMAFEKLHIGAGSDVTSFVILMNNLIDADKDVTLLASKKILANGLGNEGGAAELFSLLGKGAAMDLDSNITSVHKMVNNHCNQPWNEWYASLRHVYFQNPWAIISLVAAFLGFVILILQAVYQICEYY